MKRLIIASLLLTIFAFTLVSAAGDLTATIDSSSQSGNVGDTLTYTLTLSNSGTAAIDSITISSTALTLTDSTETIDAPTITDVTTLENGTDQTISFTVTIPSTAAGQYTGTITATDDADSANTEDITYTVDVSTEDSFTLDPTSFSIETFGGEEEEETLTITNDGSTTLTSWTVSFKSEDDDEGKIEDEDNDEITITFSDPETSLSPGSSMTVTVDVEVDDDVDAGGDYEGTITVSATGSASVSVTASLDVDVTPDICEAGKQGTDFDVTIEEPESNDDFNPGETVTVEVDVENKGSEDLDTVIEVILYNEDEGKKEKVVKENVEIEEDESESFRIELELPTDLDDDDTFYIYVQVHEDGNEDDSCDYEKVRIDIEREDEDVQITEVTISPDYDLVCSDEYRVSVFVESLGTDEMEELYVEIFDGDLDVSESSASFDLGDYNDDDNDNKVSFDLTLPSDIEEGSYYLEAIVYDEHGNNLDSELILVETGACEAEADDTTSADLTVTIDEEYDVDGEELTIALIIENSGDTSTTISVGIEEVTWATLDGTEYLDTLNPGDAIHAYLYLTLDMTTESEHDMLVIVTDENGNEFSEIITVDFGEAEVVEDEEDAFFDGITGWVTSKASSVGSFWIIADIILVILALVFLRMLFTKK